MRGVPALARAWTPQGGGEAAVVSSRSTLDHSTATPTPPPLAGRVRFPQQTPSTNTQTTQTTWHWTPGAMQVKAGVRGAENGPQTMCNVGRMARPVAELSGQVVQSSGVKIRWGGWRGCGGARRPEQCCSRNKRISKGCRTSPEHCSTDGCHPPWAGLSLVTPTETSPHRDALCFVVKTWARHKTTETVLSNGWRLPAVGGRWRLAVGGGWQLAVGGWWRLAVGGWWRWAVCGSWRLAVGGWWSVGAVLKGCPSRKNYRVLKDSPGHGPSSFGRPPATGG